MSKFGLAIAFFCITLLLDNQVQAENRQTACTVNKDILEGCGKKGKDLMTINELREKINKVDQELTLLLNERAKLAIAIGKLKKANNLPLLDSKRERFVYENAVKNNKGPLKNSSVEAIFKEIITEIKSLEGEVNEIK